MGSESESPQLSPLDGRESGGAGLPASPDWESSNADPRKGVLSPAMQPAMKADVPSLYPEPSVHPETAAQKN
jgi:hypothetical protein